MPNSIAFPCCRKSNKIQYMMACLCALLSFCLSPSLSISLICSHGLINLHPLFALSFFSPFFPLCVTQLWVWPRSRASCAPGWARFWFFLRCSSCPVPTSLNRSVTGGRTGSTKTWPKPCSAASADRQINRDRYYTNTKAGAHIFPLPPLTSRFELISIDPGDQYIFIGSVMIHLYQMNINISWSTSENLWNFFSSSRREQHFSWLKNF